MLLQALCTVFRSPKTAEKPRATRSANQLRTRRIRVEPLEYRCSPSLLTDFGVDALDRFAVFQMNGGKLSITNPQTELGGDVGLGPHSIQNFSDGKIDVDLLVDSTANNTKSNNVKVAGHVFTNENLSPDNADAIDAATKIAALPPTRTLGNISLGGGNTTLTSTMGNNQINIINVSSISLNGSSTLTLSGNATDYFIINVTGSYSQTGSSAIKLVGGIDTTHVLFNILGTGQQVAFTGSSVGVGTYLAVSRDIAVSGATVNGVIIGGMNHQINITSGAKVQVNTPHFAPPASWANI